MKNVMRLVVLVMLCATFYQAAEGQTRRVRYGSTEVSVDTSENIQIKPAAGKKTVVTGQLALFGTKTALVPGAAVTVNSTLGNFFTLTPGENETINATTVGATGQILVIRITTSGTNSYTLTFGTNFLSAGTLATGTVSGKVFQITFLSDGTTYTELFRTAAM